MEIIKRMGIISSIDIDEINKDITLKVSEIKRIDSLIEKNYKYLSVNKQSENSPEDQIPQLYADKKKNLQELDSLLIQRNQNTNARIICIYMVILIILGIVIVDFFVK